MASTSRLSFSVDNMLGNVLLSSNDNNNANKANNHQPVLKPTIMTCESSNDSAFVDVIGDSSPNVNKFAVFRDLAAQIPTTGCNSNILPVGTQYATALTNTHHSSALASTQQQHSAASLNYTTQQPSEPKRKKATRITDPGFVCRKERSLGLMCRQFLQCVQDESRETGVVHIEKICGMLNVEKRRVYDIVNVMEALDSMHRAANKSHYVWRGLQHLPVLMHNLREQARKLPGGRKTSIMDRLGDCIISKTQLVFDSDLGDVRFDSPNGMMENLGAQIAHVGKAMYTFADPSSETQMRCENDSGLGVEPTTKANRNSLSHLCRRFLMMLLVAGETEDSKSVSLDVASTILIKDADSASSSVSNDNQPPSRSRCRRLYDIANVLIALKLIDKKYYMFGTKKIPLFIYIGPEPSASSPDPRSPILKRYPFAVGAYRPNNKENVAPFGNENARATNFSTSPASKMRRALHDLSPNRPVARGENYTPNRMGNLGGVRRALGMDAEKSLLRQQLEPSISSGQKRPLGQTPHQLRHRVVDRPPPLTTASMTSTPIVRPTAQRQLMQQLPTNPFVPSPLLWGASPIMPPMTPLQQYQMCATMAQMMVGHQQQMQLMQQTAATDGLRRDIIPSPFTIANLAAPPLHDLPQL